MQEREINPEIRAVEAPLLARLTDLSIRFTVHRHRPVFTVAESVDLRGVIPGGHSKNLFVVDKKKRCALVVAEESRVIDLKALASAIGLGRLSFGSATRLEDMLGVTPGSVTPFALLNASVTDGEDPPLNVILDEGLMKHDRVNFHPLHNSATITLSPEDLLRFIASCGYVAQTIALPSPVQTPV